MYVGMAASNNSKVGLQRTLALVSNGVFKEKLSLDKREIMPTPPRKRFNFFPSVVKTEKKGVVKEVRNGQSAVGIVTDSIVYPLCPLRNTETALEVFQRKNSISNIWEMF
ncbi:hypothetical protein TNCT_714261 [Trichonephila clavata]|uniref:Uncharacterized protein n=1 Tax=Trichonephila clavata TaxID=2740835 RepID=A0A8X6GUU5_TRICU|nr:hypothetical protein TNCT_714261 [Trichonephila clavata]